MLQKIKENSRPFLPTSIVQPVSLSQIKFHEEDAHQCSINPEEVAMPKKSNPVSQRMFGQGGDLRETSAFKFSISRLPKRAQPKVTGPQIMPKGPDYTSPHVFENLNDNL